MKLTTTQRTSLLTAAVLAGMVGCQDPKTSGFFSEEEPRRVDRVYEAQARAGATQDAMLQAHHFEGTKLNALGEKKLDLMMPDDPSARIVVFMNLPAGAVTMARQEAVSDYLKQRGVEPSRVIMEMGANPDTAVPAARGMASLKQADGGTGEPKSAAERFGEAFKDMAMERSSAE